MLPMNRLGDRKYRQELPTPPRAPQRLPLDSLTPFGEVSRTRVRWMSQRHHANHTLHSQVPLIPLTLHLPQLLAKLSRQDHHLLWFLVREGYPRPHGDWNQPLELCREASGLRHRGQVVQSQYQFEGDGPGCVAQTWSVRGYSRSPGPKHGGNFLQAMSFTPANTLQRAKVLIFHGSPRSSMRIQRTHLHLVLPTSARHGIAYSSTPLRSVYPFKSHIIGCVGAQREQYRLRTIHLWRSQAFTTFHIESDLAHERRQEGWGHITRDSVSSTSSLSPTDYKSKRRTDSLSWDSDTSKSRVVLSDVVPATCLLLRLRPNSAAHVQIPPHQKGATILENYPRNRNRLLKLEPNPPFPRKIM
jgi:hypothetical protein